MKADLRIRDWYRASRPGTRGAFLKQVQSLTNDSLVALLRQEISYGAGGRLRTRAELEALPRAACPDIQELNAQAPREQTLHWMFIHRKHLCSSNEAIIYREFPTCCAGELVQGRADLLAFDNALGQPILVELKDGDATDLLCGAILELLYHWSFHTRHIAEFHSLLGEFACEVKAPCRLALIAPQTFYGETARRSRQRHGEFERAIGWIAALAAREVVSIDLYAVEPDWQQQGISCRMSKVCTR